MKSLIFIDQFDSYSWILLHTLYFEDVSQEYACTGVGWGVRPKRIFEYRGGWGVQKWPFLGVRTLWMVPYKRFFVCMFTANVSCQDHKGKNCQPHSERRRLYELYKYIPFAHQLSLCISYNVYNFTMSCNQNLFRILHTSVFLALRYPKKVCRQGYRVSYTRFSFNVVLECEPLPLGLLTLFQAIE